VRFLEQELAAACGWESGRAQIHGDRAHLLELYGAAPIAPAQKCRGSEAGGVGRSVFLVVESGGEK
jgi:hypothetical protein